MSQGIEAQVGANLVPAQNGPGMRLRAAREALNLLPEDVAKHLRLSTDIIIGLEEDRYEPHLPLVFIKGYLRSYAKLTGLDEAQVLEEFDRLDSVQQHSRDEADLSHLGTHKPSRIDQFDGEDSVSSRTFLWIAASIFLVVGCAFAWIYRDQLPFMAASQTSATAESQEAQGSGEAAAASTPADPSVQTIFLTPEASSLSTPDEINAKAPQQPAAAPVQDAAPASIPSSKTEDANKQVPDQSAVKLGVPPLKKPAETNPSAQVSRRPSHMAEPHETLLF